MPSLRPITSNLQPSIHEIASSILSPSSRCCRAPIHLAHLRIRPTNSFHTSSIRPSAAPKSTDRGPISQEDTQTDFGNLNVLGNTPAPSTSIDACLWDGFHLNSGVKIVGGSGVLLVGGEAFAWRPWAASGTKEGEKRLLNPKGVWGCGDEAWGVLSLVWPKPDLLILGLGPSMAPLSPATRQYINSLGIRVDIQDTRNAAAQFNLLATERGVGDVAAALVPIGWREGRGIVTSG